MNCVISKTIYEVMAERINYGYHTVDDCTGFELNSNATDEAMAIIADLQLLIDF